MSSNLIPSAKIMNILIIGSGGREHALAWKIKQSPQLKKLFIAPGNAGTALLGENVFLDVLNYQVVLAFIKEKDIDLIVIGPDNVLATNLVDFLKQSNVKVFGPTKEAARIEWSKSFAKELLKQLAIPTAQSQVFTDIEKAKNYIRNQTYPLVIKADGLALGKGVVIAYTKEEGNRALEEMMEKKSFSEAGEKVVIEEYLEGEEISMHAFSDGENISLFPPAQDHKRIFDNDKGPNTGGMGTIAPVPAVSQDVLNTIEKHFIRPVILELKKRGHPFVGVLFPGIILTKDGPKVLEFNARFGDPETQSYMRLLQTDLISILIACVEGRLHEIKIDWSKGAACTVVLASGGYPGNYKSGFLIRGVAEAEALKDVVVFHAGTKMENNQLITNGGRVLGVSATGAHLEEARKKAYKAVSVINFKDKQYRSDIA